MVSSVLYLRDPTGVRELLSGVGGPPSEGILWGVREAVGVASAHWPGIAFLTVALQVWKIGVRHYRSTGS